MTREKMVEQFLCPGCTVGHNTKCGNYKPRDEQGFGGCGGHSMGTTIFPAGIVFALGMPKGFNRGGVCPHDQHMHSQMVIRLFAKGEKGLGYDKFNIPVWALGKDGFLFVRVVMPRRGDLAVDVIEGGKLKELCPDAIDVGEFYAEID